MKMENTSKIRLRDLSFSYQDHTILENVSTDFPEKSLTAVIGPSGQGKSTLLTILNRLWEDHSGACMKGRVEISFNGVFTDIYNGSIRPEKLRRQVGMVFQTANPLPVSIRKNVLFPLKLAGLKKDNAAEERMETVLRQAFLWDEVKDRLDTNALALSGGQQQRLCIARALMLQPEVLLLDEPTSSLDSKACTVIEELMIRLRKHCTLIVVSHYLDQVRRIADTVFELKNRRLQQV